MYAEASREQHHLSNRGVVWDRESGIAILDRPDQVVGPTDILIEVEAPGLCGTDLHIAAGEYPLARTDVVLGHE